jgi:hypothetical protein
MARTASCLVAPTWQCVAGEQTGCSCHFRRPFFVSFFGRTKKEKKVTLIFVEQKMSYICFRLKICI